MNIRNYNIYFHTHTISGIIICALLYVIFFAGSFSFFKDEISAWQGNQSYEQHKEEAFPYGTFLDSLDWEYGLSGRDITLYFYPNTTRAYVNLSASKDTSHHQNALEGAYFNYDFVKQEAKSYSEAYDLGEFLYRLHFFAQLNEAFPFNIGYPFGYIVAGLVSFLFLFALITGIMLHWDKIVSNFYLFRPWAKAKTIWTDIHTALGVIGFPFQFVFAVTGIILIINTVLLMPFSKVFYQGDMEKVFEELEYNVDIDRDFVGKPLESVPDIAHLIKDMQAMWPDAFVKRVTMKHYGDESMSLIIEADADRRQSFSGAGFVIYDVKNGEVLRDKSPNGPSSYLDKVKSLIYRLHFGDYGGYFLKIVYFVLGIMGCIVITSGIMIWLVARDKGNIPKRKRRFNFWLSNIYLAICLTMFPVTAFTFIVVKANGHADQSLIYQVYFYSWLLLSLYYSIRRNLSRTNRETLLLGAILSLLVVVSNGLFSGNWPWYTLEHGAMDIFFLDMFWLCLAVIAFISYMKIRKGIAQKA
ncbi:PepSY-associated TM helix domain-containing protein [Olivibacter sitiensis]|uniref:PepSY-associated TM helix domain-containing protein n=1 Tax=Olivibacter sitiensis TaxID=376470 RepID=UPI00042A49AF|nr:PepSY-associated TM helix domain-containing protein [Olivibacter sitiensis]